MLKEVEEPARSQKAAEISEWLANHSEFKTHGRLIQRDQLISKDLLIENLEDDQTFQDLVLSVFHTTTITLDGTIAVKVIENHLGKAFLKLQQRKPQAPAILQQLPAPAAPKQMKQPKSPKKNRRNKRR